MITATEIVRDLSEEVVLLQQSRVRGRQRQQEGPWAAAGILPPRYLKAFLVLRRTFAGFETHPHPPYSLDLSTSAVGPTAAPETVVPLSSWLGPALVTAVP